MVKKLFLIVLVNCSLGYSQETAPKPKKRLDFAFSPGLIQQRNTFAEANLLIGKIIDEPHPKVPTIGISGVRIGIESDFTRTIAPKIGYEYDIVGLSLRLSTVNYFQERNSELRLLPEIGISLCGWANLTYGYGIPLNNGDITDIGHHRVALSFNLNKSLSKAVFKDIHKVYAY